VATLDAFHSAVRTWFQRRFPGGPTEAQERGLVPVRAGADTLIAAPTGSGKTLAGFLGAIDAAYREHERGAGAAGTTRLVYVSPLKALAVDIQQNLERPLAEIAEVAAELGVEAPAISVAVRTGDTTPSARAAMLRRPPTFLVTTPESLYLLLTARRSRALLRDVRTVIVDEIHALARDKRGSHLALSLERLERLASAERPQRIGLSATQRPIEQTARLLTGSRARARAAETAIVDCGHLRELDLRIELPGSELGAAPTTEQLGEVVDRIAGYVSERRTTLVFVNTRRLSERLAHLLGERLGEDEVAAHHGSLSFERRRRTEERLRAGELRALVATASLELGIDVGPVELVCQIGSPRAIATLLQRVGRANHSREGVPEGVLIPLTRDELVECAALTAAVRAGRLDRTWPPAAPLDILAQQLVAEVAAAEEATEEELFALARGAAPYAELSRERFEEVLELLGEGIETGRGRRMAYLHRDRVEGVVRPRRGARLAALTSGGAIAEVGDYRVVCEPDEAVVGSVNEDFAIESMAGDVFLLGTHAWRVRRVSGGEVRVTDAEGASPTIPFWIGEAPARTDELSAEVSALRAELDAILSGPHGRADGDGPPDRDGLADGDGLARDDAVSGSRRERALAHVRERCAVEHDVAAAVVDYLAAARAQLGVLPSAREIVFERFFDEAGGMQLVVHAPLGARVNRGWGLALRKRFCVTFDFELQAAASDDALLLSLGPQHSFPLDTAPGLVRAAGVRAALEQAVLPSPLFAARWRWNLNRALAVLRYRGGTRSPIQLQRMEADDLMAAIFPALAACQENAPPGPIEIPDHLLVRQTMEDCLHEAMDVERLEATVAAVESGEIRTRFVDSTEPSLLAHEILNGKPYTFLDDAPLEERRSRAVALRRGVPLEGADLTRLDADAIARVRGEAAPDVRNADELHDLLLSLVLMRPLPEHAERFAALHAAGRALEARRPGEPPLWCATERREQVEALLPGASFDPDRRLPAPPGEPRARDPDEAAELALRGHLDVLGPVTASGLAERTALAASRTEVALARLEAAGFAMRGSFDPALAGTASEQWCSRRLLARIHAYTRNRQRREVRPVSARELMRFLGRWQHVAAGTHVHGRAGVRAVIDRLQGFELAAGAWEEAVLPARVPGYDSAWLDELCRGGEVVWGRLAPPAGEAPGAQERRGARTPSRATPITFALREDLPWLMRAVRGAANPSEPAHGAASELLEALRARGAMFPAELCAVTGRLPGEVEEGLWELVARGLVTADSFAAVRALLHGRDFSRARRRPPSRRRLGARRGPAAPAPGEGRWALLEAAGGRAQESWLDEPDALAEQLAGQLLARWGVVFYELVAREQIALPWRELLWALRRLEARGLVRGGRFVRGFAGEQYALEEALRELRAPRRTERAEDGPVRLSAADPLNLTGVLLPGARIPALRTRALAFADGLLREQQPAPPRLRAGVGPAVRPRVPA
jgi:ATP-dependent Lhr-like helicase